MRQRYKIPDYAGLLCDPCRSPRGPLRWWEAGPLLRSGFPSTRKERDSNPWNAKRTTVFETAPIDHSGIFPKVKNKSDIGRFLGGDRGIRTPETFRFNGFQDRRYRPLSHISAAKIQLFAFMQLIRRKKILYLCIFNAFQVRSL